MTPSLPKLKWRKKLMDRGRLMKNINMLIFNEFSELSYLGIMSYPIELY